MMYIVIGADGAELKSYKTLAAAKKLAETMEGAVVMYGGEQVYPSVSTEPSDPAVPATDPADFTLPAEEDESAEEAEIVEEEKENDALADVEAIAEAGEKPVEKSTTPHRVLVRINIRSGPSLNAEKVGTADVGTILDAYEDLGDWLKIRWKGGVAYARHKNHEYVKEAK